MLSSLVDKGNTVLVIEHNLDVIKTADWIIDMGPEGGSRGGMVVAEGTPEDVAAHPDSHTGQFLAPLLDGRGAKQPRGRVKPVEVERPATKAAAKKAAPRSEQSVGGQEGCCGEGTCEEGCGQEDGCQEGGRQVHSRAPRTCS